MRVFTASETTQLLPYLPLARAIEAVLGDQRAGLVQAPGRLVMPLAGGGTLLLMPATDSQVTVTKLVTVHPGQTPSVRAEVWVIRTPSGERVALLEGSVVTARRTAAVSLLAAHKLAPNPRGPLLIVGAGVQARSHLEAFHQGLGVNEVYVYSRTPERSRALAEYAQSLGITARTIENPLGVVEQVSLIVTATTSPTPVLPDEVQEEAFVAAVGAYRPDMAELPASLVRRARLFVDTLEGARSEAGDLIQAGIDWSQVRSLSDVLEEAPPSAGPVVFKSVGHALWDLAACRLALEQL
ncbi:MULTISPECIES: delta(1)-pyrroline-2-carboxylate reductase family protein [unclassified Meiothermus]|uniref:delta(1)-pyrroline-2-carboxylate reductase family protein n=1 Tax=unclassified Meiothermus TaxID=370471 RepID=UPI000D7BF4A3|nr:MULTISPECIES: delta(1)-pyrroline-2-carboxylate reductase family protein [unclassified Meiothermus]PZA08842.1 delta(1)-pyrroline-2-carboxylate reductase family protein [Meiothermus sp. Pnk-1]RYM36324.1 delta(1)-pyrroline-2-carboxylate reductase family protein [Meiothermus sp. PNK-Is4]